MLGTEHRECECATRYSAISALFPGQHLTCGLAAEHTTFAIRFETAGSKVAAIRTLSRLIKTLEVVLTCTIGIRAWHVCGYFLVPEAETCIRAILIAPASKAGWCLKCFCKLDKNRLKIPRLDMSKCERRHCLRSAMVSKKARAAAACAGLGGPRPQLRQVWL